jgi:site-specific DNA recombinase
MRAIGYIRVSTEEQSREGVSLEMQTAKIRAYAELNDIELVGIYGDPGISGKSIKARPGVQAVMDLVARKRIEHVIIYKLDRLARNTVETLEMVEAMDKASVALHGITEKLDTQSAIGRFVVRTLASLAEMERDMISERTTAALQSKKANGQRVGEIPFGYALADDGIHLEEDEMEQEIIERIHNLKGKGYSFRGIADELNRDGYQTKKGKSWTHRQVSRILKEAA